MKNRTGCLVKRGERYYCRWTVDSKIFVRRLLDDQGRPITEKKQAIIAQEKLMAPFAKASEVEALEAIAGRLAGRKAELEAVKDQMLTPLLLKDAWATYVDSSERPQSGKATLKQYQAEFTRFIAWMGRQFPDKQTLRDVSNEMAKAYADDLRQANVSPSTFNQHIGFLRLLWKTLNAPANLAGVNPWASIHRMEQRDRLARRHEALTQDDFDAILATVPATDADYRDLFIALAMTGQRLVDVVMMPWRAIDLKRGVITLAPRKTIRTGKEVYIPLLPPMRTMLANRLRSGELVFPGLAAAYQTDSSAIPKRIKAIFQRAGLSTSKSVNGRNHPALSAHSFRHFFVSAARAVGIPDAVIKSITGHAGDGMVEHYSHFTPALASALAGRVAHLPALPGAKEPLPAWARDEIGGLAQRLTPQTIADVKARLLAMVSV